MSDLPDILRFVGIFAVIILFLIVFGILMCIAGYFFLKSYSANVNLIRNTWKETARYLGLEIEKGYHLRVGGLEGIYKNHRVKISHQRIPKRVGSLSTDYYAYTICEVNLVETLDFPFEVRAEDHLIQKIAKVVGKGDVKLNILGFDKSFYVDSPDERAIIELLSVDLSGGRTPYLATDLLRIKKDFYDLKISDESVQLKQDEEFYEAPDIEKMLDSAIYLAECMELARKKL